MARPKKPIDPTIVDKLAGLQCTLTEIGCFFGVNASTIQRRFAKRIAKAREKGKCSLRRAQWKAAKAGNSTMLKWLGMQWLGQTDRQDVTSREVGDPKQVAVKIEGNWYGNANRLSALGFATPVASPVVAGAAQDSGERPAVGKNGNGSNGNGHGTWPYSGRNGGSN
jgi:hypothetical protein